MVFNFTVLKIGHTVEINYKNNPGEIQKVEPASGGLKASE
jgi:hypothetical protein